MNPTTNTEAGAVADVAGVARGVTIRPALALMRWPEGEALIWPVIVELAREPQDRTSMAFKRVVQPLIDRGLLYEVSPGSYNPVTTEFTYPQFDLTPLGLAVRRHLKKNDGSLS
jgi:hypothetical protein